MRREMVMEFPLEGYRFNSFIFKIWLLCLRTVSRRFINLDFIHYLCAYMETTWNIQHHIQRRVPILAVKDASTVMSAGVTFYLLKCEQLSWVPLEADSESPSATESG
jgi:hypothetical protein